MKIWNLLFYVDLETSSKIKLICVPTQYYWSIPFSAVNSIFLKTFSCVCQIYVAEVLIIHFSNYYLLRILSPYEYWSEVSFGGSTPDLDPAPDPYLGCNFMTLIQGPPLSPAPVPSMSHLRSCGGQLRIWIQFQINIWVVHFDLNFHCIDIMLTLTYLQNSIFCPITLFQVVRFELFLHKQGLFFQIIIFSTNNLILSSKLNVLSHNSIPSC